MSGQQKIIRAGVIPALKKGTTWYYMFMKPSNALYGGEKYQIAKGRVEENESNETAALREGNEELGLRLDNITHVEYMGVFLGRTHIYVANVVDQFAFDTTTFETGETVWLSASEYDLIGRELHKDIISRLDVFCGQHFT